MGPQAEMRILFVLPRMVSGGVERVTLTLIREFVRDGHPCALALRRAQGEWVDEASGLCDVFELAPHGLHEFVPSLARRISTWKPTHVVTAFVDVGVLAWLAMRKAGARPRWIHGVHNTHSAVTAHAGIRGRFRFWLEGRFARFVYRRADAVVAVSDGVRSEVVDGFHVEARRVTTIYNPVIAEGQLRPVPLPRHDPREPYTIVGLGRLARQKGFDVLIEAMACVPQPWRLHIWGEGDERPRLENLIARGGLQDAILLRGFTDAPHAVLERADLFVLPSRHEGLPTVLIEALAAQCQIVAADCPHGPHEILQAGRVGQLVPAENPRLLGDAIKNVMAGGAHVDPWDMLERARDFTIGAAFHAWRRLLLGSSENAK